MSGAADRIAARIVKALATARDQGGTPEGETAARIAQAMMDEHALSMADLDTASREEQDPLAMERVDVGDSSMWRRSLMGIVARHCTLRSLYTEGSTKMKLFGHAHDIAVASYLFDVIARQVQQGADKHMRGLKNVTSGEARSAHNAFACSAVRGVKEKLAEMAAAKVKAAGPAGTALALQDREARMLAFFERAKGNTSSGAGMVRNHSAAGYQAGKNVSIHAGVGAPAGMRALGGS